MRDAETFETAMHAPRPAPGFRHDPRVDRSELHRPNPGPVSTGHAPGIASSMAFNMKGIIAQKLGPTVREDPKRVPIVRS
ncbi:MAG: hypothetical protein Ct9H300mP1_16290 [Planctomycetaceae bacterium]|nr:MAG: hypothetical protein Ct9H300mP1_16290 [Planctomycetaceae bacterium]